VITGAKVTNLEIVLVSGLVKHAVFRNNIIINNNDYFSVIFSYTSQMIMPMESFRVIKIGEKIMGFVEFPHSNTVGTLKVIMYETVLFIFICMYFPLFVYCRASSVLFFIIFRSCFIHCIVSTLHTYMFNTSGK
jgi:hypothetical protein